MGLMDRIKKVTGTNEAYDEAYDDDYYGGFDGYNDSDDMVDDMQMNGAMNAPMGGMSAPMQSAAASGISLSASAGSNIQMQVVRPQSFDSASQIADHLLNKCTVVLNLEGTNKETSRRLIDFLSGVAYSIDGAIKRVATQTYVITPSSVNIEDAQLKKAQKQARDEEPVREEPAEDFGDFN